MFKSVHNTDHWENDPANDTPVLHPNISITSDHYHELLRDAERYRAAVASRMLHTQAWVFLDKYIEDNDDD